VTPLWDWVLGAYERPGVAETCLKLQDEHGQNTSLLLWALRARPAAGAALDRAAKVARAWDETVLHPLRTVRRQLKAPCPPVEDLAREGLRADVKAAELRAERVLVETLEGLGVAGDGGSALEAVTAATRAWGRTAPVETLAALTDAVA
jgi:uncharacterized protein (TIGR02444 family)